MSTASTTAECSRRGDDATMSTLSSLTTLSSITSPSASYRTASECTPNHLDDVTEASSPGEHDCSPRKSNYRDATQLPRELKERCQIHLEEQTYVAAINLLNTLLCDGASQPYAPTKPALVPPPGQLGVLATLAIHPTHTSRIADSGHHDICSLSLSYLRNLLATVGPVNANFRDAFVFHDFSRRGRKVDNHHRDDSESDEDHVRGKLANANSVWTRGQDFWKVLGWAFNCSALYPHRWRWWKPWLEFVVDAIEADYKERERMDEEVHRRSGKQGPCNEYPMLEASLLMSYIAPKARMSSIKPIISALFADGSASSLALYGGVFLKEKKVPTHNSRKRKRDRVDLENDKFGDYDDDSSTGGSEPPTPEKLKRTTRDVDHLPSWTDSSLTETIPFRLRLFALLSRAGDKMPEKSTINLELLYEQFTDRIRLLPLPAFQKFIATHATPLPEFVLVTIIRFMMPALLPTVPDPNKIDPKTGEESISMKILEHCYLPFAQKASVENNAKLSLAVEHLFRILWKSGEILWTQSLEDAVEKGVNARSEKAKVRKNNRSHVADEQAARDVLNASGSRLLTWMEILKSHCG